MSVVGKSLAGMISRVERASTVGVEAQFVAASSVAVINIAASTRINMLQRVSRIRIKGLKAYGLSCGDLVLTS